MPSPIGDPIHAVIRGAAVNNDGAGKVGYTAPSVDGQAEVIADGAGAAPASTRARIGYVEAHGTGTPLGDPIEIAALTKAFRARHATRAGFCAIGSVKANIGHLDAAAGVAGLIKTVAGAARTARSRRSLNFTRPNPRIDFEAAPFRRHRRLPDRGPAGRRPRRAGVSSFGIGGTNAHVIVDEAPAPAPTVSDRTHHLLVLSAPTRTALDQATANLVEFLQAHPETRSPTSPIRCRSGGASSHIAVRWWRATTPTPSSCCPVPTGSRRSRACTRAAPVPWRSCSAARAVSTPQWAGNSMRPST